MIYLKIFSLGNVIVGTIMVTGAVFQGLGKTCPILAGAVLDNALFACLVFSLPVYFKWGIESVWWIKLTTTAVEMIIITAWLKSELHRVRPTLTFNR